MSEPEDMHIARYVEAQRRARAARQETTWAADCLVVSQRQHALGLEGVREVTKQDVARAEARLAEVRARHAGVEAALNRCRDGLSQDGLDACEAEQEWLFEEIEEDDAPVGETGR